MLPQLFAPTHLLKGSHRLECHPHSPDVWYVVQLQVAKGPLGSSLGLPLPGRTSFKPKVSFSVLEKSARVARPRASKLKGWVELQSQRTLLDIAPCGILRSTWGALSFVESLGDLCCKIPQVLLKLQPAPFPVKVRSLLAGGLLLIVTWLSHSKWGGLLSSWIFQPVEPIWATQLLKPT